MIPAFTIEPPATTFIVNVIHVHPGKQEEAFQLIRMSSIMPPSGSRAFYGATLPRAPTD